MLLLYVTSVNNCVIDCVMRCDAVRCDAIQYNTIRYNGSTDQVKFLICYSYLDICGVYESPRAYYLCSCNTFIYISHLVRDCLPVPPTPTRRPLPRS